MTVLPYTRLIRYASDYEVDMMQLYWLVKHAYLPHITVEAVDSWLIRNCHIRPHTLYCLLSANATTSPLVQSFLEELGGPK